MAEVNGRNHVSKPARNGEHAPIGYAPAPLPQASAPRSATPARLTIGEITGREVVFGSEELLVSKTDLKGHITYANDAFRRVAGFSEEELMGQAHNVIRHPEMPRAVFDLLWKQIQAGKEIFAYVVNLTKSGDHYWVLAHVTPTFGEQGNVVGYHSNRRYADPQAVARIKSLYDRMVAEERGHANRREAIAASTKVLEATLAELKLSYDEFIFSF
ncbi:MAG: PAS domain-containing protein [Archangiaceae bacterium]|nr:PAS domain-containing protein [Archangiaceae bacterium]